MTEIITFTQLGKGQQILKAFPPNIKFKYSWRNYQQRALTELDGHLSDDHLHIVAPPGSGKTVLGLEVALRLNKPTLIFAPSIAIRDQWVQRFCELFLQTDIVPDWISIDIKQPAFFTASTYQGLHTALTSDEAEQVLADIKTQNYGTIVIDEAHHLKNAWWRSLIQVKDAISPIMVGLTATPPYDVTYAEWQRYIELNGPVDAEITVPELVKEGDLCPHQDHIYLSKPTEIETQKIYKYRLKAQELIESIKQDEALIQAISSNAFFVEPMDNLRLIYDELSDYIAIIIFLNGVGVTVGEAHLEVVGDKTLDIPPLDHKWLGKLLEFYLFKDIGTDISHEQHKEKLLHKLKRAGVLNEKTIKFFIDHKLTKQVSASISKLDSIEVIAEHEYEYLGEALRMVVLTDFIRKEYLTGEQTELKKLGAISVFEKLRRNPVIDAKVGVLTGSIVIIPRTAVGALVGLLGSEDPSEIAMTELPYDNAFMLVSMNGAQRNNIVSSVTELFQQGYIQVLIGTRALLGEGWDAPAINSLVLASYVGSFVLSNQMRGRAIRTQRGNDTKASNIWHLACIDPTSNTGGPDVSLMERRFKTFVGISNGGDPFITNGAERIGLFEAKFTDEDIERHNNEAFEHASERDQLKLIWQNAIDNGTELVHGVAVKMPREYEGKKSETLYYGRTVKHLASMSGFAFIDLILVLAKEVPKVMSDSSLQNMLLLAITISSVFMFTFGGLAYKTGRLYIKHRDIAKDIEKVGKVLLQTLIDVGMVFTPTSELKVVAEVSTGGMMMCYLNGASSHESNLFISGLEEIIGVVDDPRYIVTRHSKLAGVIAQQDYHSIPMNLARHKKTAEVFHKHWCHYFGDCDLIYTRTLEGRKMLLKARLNSLSAAFEEERSELVNKWR